LSNLAPKDAPSQKTVIEWDRRQPTTKLDRLPGALLYDWITVAIRKRDAKFFDEIARILRERIITHRELGPAFSSPDEHILLAYIELKEVGKEPTKKQIRESCGNVGAITHSRSMVIARAAASKGQLQRRPKKRLRVLARRNS
jgi:hypothetical protein